MMKRLAERLRAELKNGENRIIAIGLPIMIVLYWLLAMWRGEL